MQLAVSPAITSSFDRTSQLTARTDPAAHDECQSYLHAAYQAYAGEEVDLATAAKDSPLARTLVLAAPLITYARRRLREALARTLAASAASAPESAKPRVDADALERLLYAALPRQILSMTSRTLVLEMHVLKMQGRLTGDSSQARFNSFLEHLSAPRESLALFDEYPVLARQIVVCLRNWHAASARFAADLCSDWPELVAKFPALAKAGPLEEIDAGAGDRHRGGLSVMLLRFASGLRLVYKPRSLGIDLHFQQLLQWVNERTSGLDFRTLQVLSRPDHGWAEFIERDTAVSFEAAQTYFRRQGGYLALLYLLEATDFHYENLVAAGEHPVLVDLEALFQPRLQDASRSSAGDVAGRELNYSVLRVGLLPQRLFNDEKREGLDVSGLGARAGQTTPFELPVWASAGTDEMHLIRQHGTFTGSPNTLRIDGVEVDATEYSEDIVAGFEQVYRVLLNDREALLRERGPLARFANDEVRVLLRATRTYARLMQESFHPDVLRDFAGRERLFDALDTRVDHVPGFDRVTAAERRELWNGDIPVFTTRPGGLALQAGDGTVVDDFFSESSLSLVQRQLRRLSPDDLARQVWYIRAAMTTLARGNIESDANARTPLQPLRGWTTVDPQPLALARAIGDRLAALAIRGEHDASWIGLALVNSRSFDLAPLALDLYDGLPGVALFLAYLGDTTGEAKYTQLARETVASIRAQLPKARSFEKSIGAFNGWGGLVYLFTHLGTLWNDRELLNEAESLIAAIEPLIDDDRELDIIGGSAGCLVTLLQLHEITGSTAALEAATRCGARLRTRAEAQAIGIGWMGNVPGPKPLAGFSHGTSGIAWALLKLSAATGRPQYRRMAHEALTYERTLFSAEHGNWKDIRETSREREAAQHGQRRPKFQIAWCHGAPGIAISRILMRDQLDDDVTRTELSVALETTVRHGLEGSQCLCHGAFGNVDALLLARRMPAARYDTNACEARMKRVLEQVASHGPRCANPAGIESPGLMTGLAGIGYGLLRLASPDTVPSILALAPPIRGPRA